MEVKIVVINEIRLKELIREAVRAEIQKNKPIELSELLVGEIDCSVRAYNALRFKLNCKTVEDISKLTFDEVKCIKGVGKKTIDEIEAILNKYGFSLNKQISGNLIKVYRGVDTIANLLQNEYVSNNLLTNPLGGLNTIS